MNTNVDVTVIPLETLEELAPKRADWVLAMLQRETIFDVGAIALLLNLGQQAIHAELERRRSLVPGPVEQPEVDAALAAMFGGVLNVSIEGSEEPEEIAVVEAPREPMLFTVVHDDRDGEAEAVDEKLERWMNGMPGMKVDGGDPF